VASVPYIECDKNILDLPAIVLYSTAIACSIVSNLWVGLHVCKTVIGHFFASLQVAIVTLGHRHRRQEPYTLNSINFVGADFLIIIYSTAIVLVSVHLYDSYYLHMDTWLNSILCPVIGFMLLTGTTAASFFYNLAMVMIYYKVAHSMRLNKHIGTGKLLLASIICWTAAVVVSAVPFGFNGSYSHDGQCLPFYSDENHTGFKFFLVYTVVKACCFVFNASLATIIAMRFCNHARTASEVSDPIQRENEAIVNMAVGHMTIHFIFTLTIIFCLLVSCTKSKMGKQGREIFSHLCVMETVFWPFLGPMRSSNFYRDTWKLLCRGRCRGKLDSKISTVPLHREMKYDGVKPGVL
jgi:hypothetical protein